MNNLNYCQNLNSQNYGPKFSQSGNNLAVPNCQISQETPYDTCQISFPKKKEKTFLDKFLTAMTWVGGICLGGFCVYKTVDYFNPGVCKRFFSKIKNRVLDEKSEAEKTFLQKFNEKFKSCTGNFEQQEKEYVEEAFKNKLINEDEKAKFLDKIEMRKTIRTFNNTYGTQITLSPYGGVEQLAQAHTKIKSLNIRQRNIFNTILDYKIQKLTDKQKLLTTRQYETEEEYLEIITKYNRTNDLLNSLISLKNLTNDEYKKVYHVDYTEQTWSEEIKTTKGNERKIEVENEVGINYDISLSETTFKNLFGSQKMLEQRLEDCYLVGTLNAIINNPKHRCEFYQMFSEDENFIIFKFKDGFKVKFPKGNDGKPQLLNCNHLQGATGYQMFEEAYALYRLHHQNNDRAVNKDHSTEAIENILQGGTIHEVANCLFSSGEKAYCLNGYHFSSNNDSQKTKSDEEISTILTEMMKKGQSIVVGRDEFKAEEQGYDYQGVTISNSHFSVVRYFNEKTREVHIYESNKPDKVLILPLSEFNKEYSILYSF